MLKQQNTVIYENPENNVKCSSRLFTLLFELVIGALWAIVTVLALMGKQAVPYVSAGATLAEQAVDA